VFSDRVREMESIRNRIGEAIENLIGIRVNVCLVEPHAIERSQGKARRVLDQRSL